MNQKKFTQLILDVYCEWKKPKNKVVKSVRGEDYESERFYGIIYNSSSEDESFYQIPDIEKFIKLSSPVSFSLNSYATGEKIKINKSQLLDYRIEGNNLILEINCLSNSKEVVFEF